MIRYWSVILLVWIGQLCAQSPFQLLPEIGLDNQSRAEIVVAHTNHFTVIGDHIDTSVVGFEPGIWPHQMMFDYNGNMLTFQKLIDSTYFKPFIGTGYPIKLEAPDCYYYYAHIDTGGPYYLPYILKIDFATGLIKKSLILDHPKGPEERYNTRTMGVANEQNILLANYYRYNDTSYVDIVELDTSLNIIRRPQIIFYDLHNAPFWITKNYEGHYEIIGDSWPLDDGIPIGISRPFYLRTDTTGVILKFKVLDTEENLGSWIADSYMIHRESNGDWIMAQMDYVTIDTCFNCYNNIPYVIRVSPQFDSILWKTRFQTVPYAPRPFSISASLTKSNDNSGYVVSGSLTGSNFPGLQKSKGIVFKVSNEGDSLWMRKYTPLGWEEGRALWMKFDHITSTPHNTYLVASTVSDTLNKIVRSWILHLDEHGCLVPGCHITNSDGPELDKQPNFRFHPNPVKDKIYVQSLFTASAKHALSIVDLNGRIIKSLSFTPSEDVQYILDASNFPAGSYFLSIKGSEGEAAEVFKFVKL